MKLFYFIVLLLGVIALSEARDAKCLLPAETGICRGQIPSFYFDNKTGKCEKFTYGGCQGNDNRFATIAECQAACQ